MLATELTESIGLCMTKGVFDNCREKIRVAIEGKTFCDGDVCEIEDVESLIEEIIAILDIKDEEKENELILHLRDVFRKVLI